ncbi:hypothetical protein pb186bvf_009766 [Paramecium bursaria]
MSIQRKSKVIMSSETKWVEITIQGCLLEDFQAEIERNQKKKSENKNSCKQVVPFLMNQFFKWSKSRDRDLYNQLKKLKLSKTSKQKKFEFGDLQLMFSKWDPDQITSDQDLWIEFLRFHAVQQIENSKKIRTENMKEKYIQQIKKLLEELNRLTPYKGYLSIHQQQQIQQNIPRQNSEEYFDYQF